MKIIRNPFIPLPGFKAINLLGVLFVRREATLSEADLRHEAIHTRQMKEMLYLPFYLWYALEWIVRLWTTRHPLAAYHAIGFEREAYARQDEPAYLDTRPLWAFTRYLKQGKEDAK